MRNLLVLLLVVVVVWFSGFFIVEQREVGVVINTFPTPPQVYSPGIHWKKPLIGEFYLVYTNLRSAYINSGVVLTSESGESFTSGALITWHVISPVAYLNFLRANSSKDLDSQISQAVIQQLITIAAKSPSLPQFSTQVQQVHNLSLPKLGISIVSLSTIGVVHAVPLPPKPPLPSATDFESAYTKAQQIKQDADNELQQQLAKLEQQDHRFYNYYMQIRQLQMQESSAPMPSFQKLYAN